MNRYIANRSVTSSAAVALTIVGIVSAPVSAQIITPRHPQPSTAPILVTPTAQPTPRPKITLPANMQLLSAKTVDEFIAALPDWTKVSRMNRPDKQTTADGGTSTENKDGRNYTVTRTKYSITETPDEIVTYQPVNGFWLGALVQEKGLREGLGSMQEIAVPATKRAPLKISTDLPMGANYRDINAPSATTVSSAIGDLQTKGNNSGWGGARTLKIVDNFSEEQTAHDLGLSASYMGASLKAAFSADRYNKKHTITASFIEKAFTAQADFEGRSRRAAFFNDSFTIDDAKALVDQKRIEITNLPTYIKSITYGRVVVFNLTSTLSNEEMKAAVDASYNGGVWSASGSYKGSDKAKNAQFELRVTEFGGLQSGFSKLVPAQGIENVFAVMNSYLNQNAPLTSMRPISYTANTLRDDQLAAMPVTTEYTVTKYAANAIGEKLKIKMWVDVTGSDDGVADNTLECYGSLRVNGDTWWEIGRGEADQNKRESGQVVAISEDAAHSKKDFTFEYYYDQKTPFNIDLRLTDSDGGSADDPFGKFNLKVPIAGEGTWTYNWNSGDGESSKLHIKVVRVDYL